MLPTSCRNIAPRRPFFQELLGKWAFRVLRGTLKAPAPPRAAGVWGGGATGRVGQRAQPGRFAGELVGGLTLGLELLIRCRIAVSWRVRQRGLRVRGPDAGGGLRGLPLLAGLAQVEGVGQAQLGGHRDEQRHQGDLG